MNPTPKSELTLTATHYCGDSNASGQIPLRAVEEDLTGRFQAQFFFESRLRDEPEPVADVHFTLAHPFTVLGGVAFLF